VKKRKYPKMTEEERQALVDRLTWKKGDVEVVKRPGYPRELTPKGVPVRVPESKK
jgi:hypothetical protein